MMNRYAEALVGVGVAASHQMSRLYSMGSMEAQQDTTDASSMILRVPQSGFRAAEPSATKRDGVMINQLSAGWVSARRVINSMKESHQLHSTGHFSQEFGSKLQQGIESQVLKKRFSLRRPCCLLLQQHSEAALSPAPSCRVQGPASTWVIQEMRRN